MISNKNIKYIKYFTGLVLVLTGVAGAIAFFDKFLYFFISVLMAFWGLRLVNSSVERYTNNRLEIKDELRDNAYSKRVPFWVWISEAILVLMTLFFWFFLNWEAGKGYGWTWPLYAFVVSGLGCVPLLVYIASKKNWFIG